MENISYVTGRNSEKFVNLQLAKDYANKWKDKSISVYKNGTYFFTIHKKNEIWNEQN